MKVLGLLILLTAMMVFVYISVMVVNHIHKRKPMKWYWHQREMLYWITALGILLGIWSLIG